jgi:hypothetical protein
VHIFEAGMSARLENDAGRLVTLQKQGLGGCRKSIMGRTTAALT